MDWLGENVAEAFEERGSTGERLTGMAKQPASPRTGGSDPVVLIVEDNAVIGLDFQLELEETGIPTVDIAADLDQARNLMTQKPYDLALLDVKLREGETFELARELRASGAEIAFVSGLSGGDELPSDLRDAPFFEKPVAPDAILSLLRREPDAA